MDIKRLLPSISEMLRRELKSLGVMCQRNTTNITECCGIRTNKTCKMASSEVHIRKPRQRLKSIQRSFRGQLFKASVA